MFSGASIRAKVGTVMRQPELRPGGVNAALPMRRNRWKRIIPPRPGKSDRDSQNQRIICPDPQH